MKNHKIITDIIDIINDKYIDQSKTAIIEAKLLEYIESDGVKDDSTDIGDILDHINEIIQNITNDAHFVINLYETNNNLSITADDYGITRYNPPFISIVEFYRVDIEYTRKLYLNFFALCNGNAILDLRNCTGGDPDLAYFIACIIFPENTLLLEIVTKTETKTIRSVKFIRQFTSYNTIGNYTGKITVLINNRTASAAESLAFMIKNHKRGKIYGSKSAGASYITATAIIDTIKISIPIIKVLDPVSHKTWENEGITPDYSIGSREYVDLLFNEIIPNDILLMSVDKN